MSFDNPAWNPMWLNPNYCGIYDGKVSWLLLEWDWYPVIYKERPAIFRSPKYEWGHANRPSRTAELSRAESITPEFQQLTHWRLAPHHCHRQTNCCLHLITNSYLPIVLVNCSLPNHLKLINQAGSIQFLLATRFITGNTRLPGTSTMCSSLLIWLAKDKFYE